MQKAFLQFTFQFHRVHRLIIRLKTMSTGAQKRCFLKSVDQTYPNIELNANDFVFVGRSPECALRDEQVSRKQLKLKADFSRNRIVFEVMGANPSVLNNAELEPNKEYLAKHGDIIEMVPSKYPYKVCFENPDENPIDENANENMNESTHDSGVNVNVSTNRNVSQEIQVNANVSMDLNHSSKNEGAAAVLIASTNSSNTSKKQKRRIVESADDDDEDNAPLKRRKSKINLVRDKDPFGDTTAWQSYNKSKLIVHTAADCVASNKIAAYDMDGTLITTASGKVFPISSDDWKIAFGTVKSTLTTMHAEKRKIVIFTNQAGLSNGKTKLPDLRNKIEKIIKKIGVPAQVFISTGDSQFRKPMTMMWQALCDHFNDDMNIDKSQSFYVGDAAGRPENKSMKKKKDHSSADRLFALNLHLPFFTPEEHFLKHSKSDWKRPEFEPRDALTNVPDSLLDPPTSKLTSKSAEVIILVGLPGSGKSSFCKNHLASAGYEVINRDTLKSWQKCAKRCDECLKDKKKVVIDNTNGKPEDRLHYIKLAKTHKVKCRCFVMATTFSHAEHNVLFRELLDPSHPKINKIVLNTFKKFYKKPTLSEGFDEIVTVNFIPAFRNEDEKALYGMYLLGS